MLQFNSKYKSIDQLNSVTLPNFTIVTGVNGAGKSHLLEAIKEGHLTLNGIPLNEIVHFDYKTFQLDNEAAFSAHQIEQEKNQAWAIFNSHVRPNAVNWKNQIGQDEKQIIQQARESKTPFWRLNNGTLVKYKNLARNYFRNLARQKNSNVQQYARSLHSMAKNSLLTLDEIDEDYFRSTYTPVTLKSDFLPAQLGKAFWDYYIKLELNDYYRFKNQEGDKSYKYLSQEDFIARNGERPWVLANRILSSFSTLQYRFNSPEGSSHLGSFQLKLEHTKKPNLNIQFNSLSSGERILMALVASIYKASTDRSFPRLLLLDEIDASLHPSMIQNLLDVIKDILLPENVQVIAVTHSPTTIALADEDSIHLMQQDGPNRLTKAAKSEALAILTEGFATLDEGLTLLDQLSHSEITIISEGHNTRYIQEFLDHYNIANCSILTGLEADSGKNQLKVLYKFFTLVPHTTKVLFVFDCDVSWNLEESDNTYFYKFNRNTSNILATSGIENMFDENLLSDFCVTIQEPKSTEIKRQFHSSQKANFLEFISDRRTKTDFHRFEDLANKLRGL